VTLQLGCKDFFSIILGGGGGGCPKERVCCSLLLCVVGSNDNDALWLARLAINTAVLRQSSHVCFFPCSIKTKQFFYLDSFFFLFHPLLLRVSVAMVLRSEELDDQIPYDID
jgi:hypothetical protein